MNTLVRTVGFDSIVSILRNTSRRSGTHMRWHIDATSSKSIPNETLVFPKSLLIGITMGVCKCTHLYRCNRMLTSWWNCWAGRRRGCRAIAEYGTFNDPSPSNWHFFCCCGCHWVRNYTYIVTLTYFEES
jgi:hypothetical protein